MSPIGPDSPTSEPRDHDPLAHFLRGMPCPGWCHRADDRHPYVCDLTDPATDDGTTDSPLSYQRVHLRDLYRLPGEWPINLAIEQAERTPDPGDPIASTLTPPTVWLAAPQLGADLDATRARQLAAALIAAADSLDTIRAGGSLARPRPGSSDDGGAA